MTGLGHFTFLRDVEREQLFRVAPARLARDSPRLVLADALGATLYSTATRPDLVGATLYSPATRPDLVGDLRRTRQDGLVSSVICLEDSIADDQVADALDHVVGQLSALHFAVEDIPLVFVRVRVSDQITEIVERLGNRSAALAGFVVPKFAARNGREAFDRVRKASAAAGRQLWLMPVLETLEVAHRETRTRELLAIDRLLAENSDLALAVRIGATDIAAAYGLRRPKELTVYDIRVVADAITDIVNVLGRVGGDERVITGAVWEYFAGPERIFKPLLRETPFGSEERALRASLIATELDGLIREVVLDHANGIVGKTVIHPTHVPVVHALSVVSGEDYADALAVLGRGPGGGVVRSLYRNKMNESRPHRAWAKRTLRRAAAFGVGRDGVTFADLLAAVHRG